MVQRGWGKEQGVFHEDVFHSVLQDSAIDDSHEGCELQLYFSDLYARHSGG